MHRDTKDAEIYRLAGSQYLAVARDDRGWLVSDVLQVRLTHADTNRVVIEGLGDPSTRVEI